MPELFTQSGQRNHPYYRGCWHVADASAGICCCIISTSSDLTEDHPRASLRLLYSHCCQVCDSVPGVTGRPAQRLPVCCAASFIEPQAIPKNTNHAAVSYRLLGMFPGYQSRVLVLLWIITPATERARRHAVLSTQQDQTLHKVCCESPAGNPTTVTISSCRKAETFCLQTEQARPSTRQAIAT